MHIEAASLWEARHALMLNVFDFARLIGVSASTVELWEARKGAAARMLPSNMQLARAVCRAAKQARRPEKLGRAIQEAIQAGDRMRALYYALHTLYWLDARKATK